MQEVNLENSQEPISGNTDLQHELVNQLVLCLLTREHHISYII